MVLSLMLDVDGVLVTGRPGDGLSWATDLHRDLGIDPDHLNRVFFSKAWGNVVLGRRDLRDALDDCLPAISTKVSTDALLDYWFANDSRISTAVLARVDVLRARGHRVILATNQEHLRARYLMRDLGLSDHVDGMIYSAAASAKKPEPGFFAACERESGNRPQAHFLVDDSLANVEAALRAGWRACHWTGADDLLDVFPGD